MEGTRRATKHSELGGVVEKTRRADKHNQSRKGWWRGPGGKPNTLRAGRGGGGGQEGSQTHSEPGGVVEWARRAAKRTQSWEEWWRGPGGQPNTFRARRSGGGLRHYDIITVSVPQTVHLFFHR